MNDLNEQIPEMSAAEARAQIESIIPHRDPFLFVDRILESSPERIVVRWQVREDSDFFLGHYPDLPVTPGVILSEHAFQAGALLVAQAKGGLSQSDGVPVLTRVRDARYKKLVAPSATIETTVEVEDQLGPAWNLLASLRVHGVLCAKIRFVLSATDAMARVSDKINNTDQPS